MSNAADSWGRVLSFAVAAVLLLLFAGSGSFLNHDEITYLVMAKEMASSGNWLDLTFQGTVIHQRPPLAIWSLAASGSVFGFTTFALRLPGILYAWLSLAGLYFLVRQLYGCERTALLAAALLLASQLFYFNARRPMTDACFLAGAMFFLTFSHQGIIRPRAWLVAGIAGGWMLMSKGVIAALPVLAVVGYLASSGTTRNQFRSRWPWLGVLVALALAAPWHLAQTVRHGASFWIEYIGFNVLQRSSSSLFAASGPFFYLEDLWINEDTLALAFGTGLVALTISWWKNRHPGDRFLLIWFVLTAIPLSAASTRISHYFLPAIPALAAASAGALRRILHRNIIFAAICLLAAAFFASNNLPHLINPDYSRDQVRFASLLKTRFATAPIATGFRLYSLNHYELALFYYTGQPVKMLTDSEQFFEIVNSAPIMHRTNAVELLSPDSIRKRLATTPFAIVTKPQYLPTICGSNLERCNKLGPYELVEGESLVMVSGSGN